MRWGALSRNEKGFVLALRRTACLWLLPLYAALIWGLYPPDVLAEASTQRLLILSGAVLSSYAILVCAFQFLLPRLIDLPDECDFVAREHGRERRSFHFACLFSHDEHNPFARLSTGFATLFWLMTLPLALLGLIALAGFGLPGEAVGGLIIAGALLNLAVVWRERAFLRTAGVLPLQDEAVA